MPQSTKSTTMKKLLLLLLLLPVLTKAQTESVPDFNQSIVTPEVFLFSKINATPTNYELPYMRYCLRKSSGFRSAGLALSFVSVAAGMYPVFFSYENYIKNHPRSEWETYNTYSSISTISCITFGAAGLVTFIIGERWFAKSAVKPIVTPDGLGVSIQMKVGY